MPDEDRIATIINNLSSLIRHHAGMTAREMYAPGADADASDASFAEHKRWTTELRAIRERFENLVTGFEHAE